MENNFVILDSLVDNVAIFDLEGDIVFVNKAWKDFSKQNGGRDEETGIGANYFKVAQDSGQEKINTALKELALKEKPFFHLEYECHSPEEKRWFLMSAQRMTEDPNLIVCSHINVTEARNRELALEIRANIDPLTGLFRREYLFDLADIELNRAYRYTRPLSILYLDIDNFKEVNDRFGHSVGDLVLKQFAQTLKSAVRTADLIGRLGGDEFLVLLPESSSEYSQKIAERIRFLLRKMEISSVDEEFQLKVSMGSASLNLEEPEVFSRVLERADQALLKAKKKGKDQVILA